VPPVARVFDESTWKKLSKIRSPVLDRDCAARHEDLAT
jgi:hypothetical protein